MRIENIKHPFNTGNSQDSLNIHDWFHALDTALVLI